MMSIEKMTLVQITGHADALTEVLMRCSDLKQFHPEHPAQPGREAESFQAAQENNPYKERLSRIVDIGLGAGIALEYDAAGSKKLRRSWRTIFWRAFTGSWRSSAGKNRS